MIFIGAVFWAKFDIRFILVGISFISKLQKMNSFILFREAATLIT